MTEDPKLEKPALSGAQEAAKLIKTKVRELNKAIEDATATHHLKIDVELSERHVFGIGPWKTPYISARVYDELD